MVDNGRNRLSIAESCWKWLDNDNDYDKDNYDDDDDDGY